MFVKISKIEYLKTEKKKQNEEALRQLEQKREKTHKKKTINFYLKKDQMKQIKIQK